MLLTNPVLSLLKYLRAGSALGARHGEGARSQKGLFWCGDKLRANKHRQVTDTPRGLQLQAA